LVAQLSVEALEELRKNWKPGVRITTNKTRWEGNPPAEFNRRVMVLHYSRSLQLMVPVAGFWKVLKRLAQLENFSER
jgi:hypothetical protein